MNFSTMFWVWIGINALFIIGEIFTAGFFLFPFAVGAGVAAVLTLLGLPSWLQWLAFIVVSGISMLLARKFAQKVTKEPPEKVAVDRLIGEIGLVIEAIDPVTDSGMVRIKKDEWRATSIDGSRIEERSAVRVVKIEGAHLVVEKME
ncbi:MAG: NfeD family protein [bacterium]